MGVHGLMIDPVLRATFADITVEEVGKHAHIRLDLTPWLSML